MHSTKDMFDYLTVKELIFYGWQLCIKKVPRIGRMKTPGTLNMIQISLEKHQSGAYDIDKEMTEVVNEGL